MNPGISTLPTRIVMPGVGVFPSAMSRLHETGLAEALHDAVITRPHTGARHLLGDAVDAHRGVTKAARVQDSGWIAGRGRTAFVPRAGRASSHMSVGTRSSSAPRLTIVRGRRTRNRLLLRSLVITPFRRTAPLSPVRTPFAGGIVTAVRVGPHLGVQFHPEKSQTAGFAVLAQLPGSDLPCRVEGPSDADSCSTRISAS